MARVVFAAVVVLALVALEWPWRSTSLKTLAPFLRLCLALSVALWLFMSTSLTPAYRHALVANDPVTTMWDQELTPYQSGVFTMDRDATLVLKSVIPPLLILTWLAAFPAVRLLSRALKSGHAREGSATAGELSSGHAA